MRVLSALRALPVLLVFVAANAVAYTPYHELRQDHPSIDAAVAAMPSSDIHGTLNRISALFERSHVRDLPAGAGTDGLLPENFEPAMVSAIQDLRDDIKDGFGSLTLEQKYALVQVFDVVVVRRSVELYDGFDEPPCIPSPEHPCPDIRPAVIREIDSLTGSVRSDINAMFLDYNATNDPDEPIVVTLTHSNYAATIDRLQGSFGYIRGVESIDYE